jgi:purine nucleosidase
MATPLIIDTDLGIDDAVAVGLALASDSLNVRGIVGVGGNVGLDQVMKNIGRLLTALAPAKMPLVGRGMDQIVAGLADRREQFGADGLGQCDLAEGRVNAEADFVALYRQIIEESAGQVAILALGPLTNLAAMLREAPELGGKIGRIVVSGGAVWTRGNAGAGVAEFNFHRDPIAASKVLTSGLPITVAPLDVTSFICLDESHVAHLASSGSRLGQVLAKLLQFALDYDGEPGLGKTHVHDAVAASALVWPDLFMRTRMRLEVATTGTEAGRCKPQLGGDPAQRVDLLTAVNAVDLLENLLESLCHEAFVV